MNRLMPAVAIGTLFGCSAAPPAEPTQPAPAAPTSEAPAPPEPAASAPPAPEPEPDEPAPPAGFSLGDVPASDASCEERLAFSSAAITRGYEHASAGCTSDADCVSASLSTGCRGSCPGAVTKQHAADYERFVTELKDRVCSSYRDDGCAYVTPRCTVGALVCKDGSCRMAYGGGSELR